MSAILNSLNAHNLPIFQPVLMILVSKFTVYQALSDKTYLLLGLLSPLTCFYCVVICRFVETMDYCYARPLSTTHRFGILEWHNQICNLRIVQNRWSRREV